MKFRFLKTGYSTAAQNMAIDEAVLMQLADNDGALGVPSANASGATDAVAPTLRFYGWKPPAISIGYFQSLEEEVDLAACKNFGIDFVRRITGGGAVLHEHEITYSIHIPESAASALGVPLGILESYKKISDGILKGLALLGLQAKFVPLNDIVLEIGGTGTGIFKKISGNAQTRKRGVILQHGTILLRVDVDKMFALLKVPSEKLKGKLIEDVKQRVTGLSDVLGREVGFEETLAVLEKGFAETFPQARFEPGELSAKEKSLAEKFAAEKYGNDEWNKKR